jgi:hypothetical protein
VEIGTEAAQFPEKEYINGILLAMRHNIKSDVKESEQEEKKRCCEQK